MCIKRQAKRKKLKKKNILKLLRKAERDIAKKRKKDGEIAGKEKEREMR